MFGQSKPVAFDPYGRRRSAWRMPRWLLLLLIGIGIGVAAVLFVQERYLPPRLSADETVKLRSAFETAEAARTRQAIDLSDTAKRLGEVQADHKNLSDELAISRSATERLQGELSSVVGLLPTDPRGGAVEVRAGQFTLKSGTLTYDVVLTRARAAATPTAGSLQFVIAGTSAHGGANTYTPPPLAVSIEAQQVLHGSLALPDGFKPQQATIQIVDHRGGKTLGMRVMLIR